MRIRDRIKKAFDVYEKPIIETLSDEKIRLTPRDVAEKVGIHWSTAKIRLERLEDRGWAVEEKVGNRSYYKFNDKLGNFCKARLEHTSNRDKVIWECEKEFKKKRKY